MALEGNISEFSLPEILQLISSQRKTGVLFLKQESDSAALDFEEGLITGGYYSRKGVQEDFSNYLFKTGILSEAELSRAEALQAQRRVPLEEVLIEEGFLTEDDFIEVIRFKIQEIMDEIFTWSEGHYTFDLKAKLYARSKYPVRLSTDSFLMEGMRRMDEWYRIRKVIPDLGVLLKRGPAPKDMELTPEQEKFLEFLGHRHLPLEQLAESSGLGKFVTCQVAAELLESGIICQETFAPAQETKVTAAAPDLGQLTAAIGLMIRQLGLIINYLALYPFNHTKVMAAMEEFFYLFDGLSLDSSGLRFFVENDRLILNGRSSEDPVWSQFGRYLSQRQIRDLAFLPQMKRSHLLSFAYLLALPADLIQSLGGLEAAIKSIRLQHIQIGSLPPPDPLLKGELTLPIPNRFLEMILNNPALRQSSQRIFQSLKQIQRLPEYPLSHPALMELEEAEQITERIFGVYSRGGRDKYIEKVIPPVMKLHPAIRITFLKRHLLDVRWPFPLDNIYALSQNEFEKLPRLGGAIKR